MRYRCTLDRVLKRAKSYRRGCFLARIPRSQLGLNQERKLKCNFLALTGSPFGQAAIMIPNPFSELHPSRHRGSDMRNR
jgi:hypothetical protein